MYHLLYGFLYLLSLLPFWALYGISDFAYLILYKLIGYRKEVVLNNLLIAFPEKTEEERKQIANEFYGNLCDSFLETVKMISMSDAAFAKRLTGNFEVLNELFETGISVHLHSGHFFNLEYMNWGVPRNTSFTTLGVYMPVSNKIFDRLMLKIRRRYNSVMLSAFTFRTTFHQYKNNQYLLELAADQAGYPPTGYWVPFFGKLAPFVTGPEKSSRLNNTAVVFVHFYKIKRGFYKADFSLITKAPRETVRGELTKLYVKYLEDCIRKTPANYLWSHRRWKWNYDEQYKKNLI